MGPGGAAAGGGGGNLANLMVQIVSTGFDELKKSLNDMQQTLGAVVLAVQKMNTQIVASLETTNQKTKEAGEQTNKLAEAFKRLGTIINVALGVSIIKDFVRQGLAAGAMGQLFDYTMTRLSLTLSGLFRPEIMKIIELINRLTTWLQSLTDKQRQQIAYWIQGAAAAAAVAAIFPRIVAGITAVIAVTKALGAAIAGAEAMTGIGAILPIIGLIVQGMTMLLVGTEQGRAALSAIWEAIKQVVSAVKELWDALGLSSVFQDFVEGAKIVITWVANLVKWVAELVKKLNELTGGLLGKVGRAIAYYLLGPLAWIGALMGKGETKTEEKNRTPDQRRIGGFEDLNATYQRIAIASMRASAGVLSPEERTAQNTEQALERLQAIEGAVRDIQPPFGR